MIVQQTDNRHTFVDGAIVKLDKQELTLVLRGYLTPKERKLLFCLLPLADAVGYHEGRFTLLEITN